MRVIRISLFLFLCWGQTISFAQTTTPIPDPAFRSYVDSFYTFLLDPVSKELKIQEAGNVTGPFYLVKRGIKTLEGIQYFKNITELYCMQNQLTALPDLSPLSNLTTLHCYQNKLTSLPSLNKLSQLRSFNVFDNQLTEFPKIDSLKNLKELILFRNRFTSIPDLSYLTQLEKLDCYENKLVSIGKMPASLTSLQTGENLLTQLPDISLATNLQSLAAYSNQLVDIPDLASYKSLTSLNLGTNKLRSLPASISMMTTLVSLTLDNNEFHDIPDFSALTQLTSFRFDHNFLTFDDVVKSSSNPHFNQWQITPQDSLSIDKVFRFAENQNIKVALAEADSSSNLLYAWYQNGTLKTTTNKPFLEFSSIEKADNGKYYCHVTSSSPSLSSFELYSNTFEIVVLPDFIVEKNLSITPNGDGKNDEMYFSEQGTLLVYDSQGRLLDQLQSPCYWNGSTKSGKELGTGYYFIEINKTTTYPVTIIR